MIRIYATILAALLGLAFGSFLNVCLTRWPAGESILKPRSHCRACGRTLAWWENIPVVSWLALRGRCRTCGAWIGWRYPLVELAIGSLWALFAWQGSRRTLLFTGPLKLLAIRGAHYYPSMAIIALIAEAAFLWWLVALAVLDSENLWLPDCLTVSGIILGSVFSVCGAYQGSWREEIIHDCCLIPVFDRENFFVLLITTVASILIAALLVLLIRWTYKLIRKREGIGLGDAKLMAMLAAWLGLAGALLSFFIGVILGALTALVLLALPQTKAEVPGPSEERAEESNSGAPSWALRKLPLGTFLCIGGIVSALWGQRILDAYFRWVGF
jgi:leader peptidase (prepilin peptidase) / N-methyltransferase